MTEDVANQPPAPPTQHQPGGQPQTQGKAITAMVLGICSIPACALYGIPGVICGVLALVFAKQASSAIEAGTAPASSAGFVKAGKICGIIGLSISALYFLIMLVMIIIAVAAGP